MIPIRFPEQNHYFGPPAGTPEGEIVGIHCYRDSRQVITCWEPTPEERCAIAAGAPVYLSVLCGGSMVPVFLTILNPFDQVSLERTPPLCPCCGDPWADVVTGLTIDGHALGQDINPDTLNKRLILTCSKTHGIYTLREDEPE